MNAETMYKNYTIVVVKTSQTSKKDLEYTNSRPF